MSSNFAIEEGVKQGDPLSLEFYSRICYEKVQKTNWGLDMNGTHQVLAYADYINLIGGDITKKERTIKLLFHYLKNIELAVNTKKTKIGN